MLDFTLNAIPVMLLGVLYHRKAHSPGYRKLNILAKCLLAATLLATNVVLSVSFSEFIRVHNHAGNGVDIVGYYLENYGLYFITVPLFWLQLKVLQQFKINWLPLLSYASILGLFAFTYFVITEEPSCDSEGDMCSYASTRSGAIAALVVLALLSMKELYTLLLEGGKEHRKG